METCLTFILSSLAVIVVVRELSAEDLTDLPGHLKPFGYGRPTFPVDEIDKFPNPKYFFDNYVKTLKPLKMKGAAKFSAGFKKWTDDYFLSLEYAPDAKKITVETEKKENRKQPITEMAFKDFVKVYNSTEYYMVDMVPEVIR